MSTTFNLELNNKPSKNKTHVVLLRITQDKKHIRKKTTIEVKNKNDFNPKAKSGKWIRTSEPNHKIWNVALEKEIEDVKTVYRDLKEKGLATKELIKSKVLSEVMTPSFKKKKKNRTEELFIEGGHRNSKKYNGFCNKLGSFLSKINKKDLLFSEINTPFIAQFESYLHTLKNARDSNSKLHPSTVFLTVRVFKTIINRAIQVDKIISPDANPFLGFKTIRPKHTEKEKLNETEIKKIEELELPNASLIWNCRNYFLFSFYMAGIRAGDLIQLRWNNITSDDRLEYRMGKNQKDRSIFIHPKAKGILNLYDKKDRKSTDFIFPLLDIEAPYTKAFSSEQKATMPPEMVKKLNDMVGSKNALINKYLKKIAALAEIEKNITFHISRHSFARIAMEKKVDNVHLKNILGHSSLKITEGYMGSFDNSETDLVMNSIFEEKTDPMEILKKQLGEMDPDELEKLILEIKNRKEKKND